jgi:hypothetical protein
VECAGNDRSAHEQHLVAVACRRRSRGRRMRLITSGASANSERALSDEEIAGCGDDESTSQARARIRSAAVAYGRDSKRVVRPAGLGRQASCHRARRAGRFLHATLPRWRRLDVRASLASQLPDELPAVNGAWEPVVDLGPLTRRQVVAAGDVRAGAVVVGRGSVGCGR